MKRILVSAAGIIIVTTMNTQMVFADEIDNNFPIKTTEIQVKHDSLNSKKLYVMEKDLYREIIKKDTPIIKTKNNVFTVDSSQLTKTDLEIIKSAGEFYVFGDFDNGIEDLKALDNYKGQLGNADRIKVALDLAKLTPEKDILVVNSESPTDYFIATQLSEIEDRIVLLVGETLEDETSAFLKEHGKDKTIMFLEGAVEIKEDLKKEILQISGSDKYELDKSALIKETKKAKEDQSVPGIPKTQVPTLIQTDNNGVTNSMVAPELKSVSKEIIEKTKVDNDELLADKAKVVEVEVKEETTVKEVVKQDKSLLVLDNEKIIENESEGHSLNLTYANPVALDVKVPENKEEFVTSKETNQEVIDRVLEGEFGTGEQRKQELTEAGYQYEEIQNKINELFAPVAPALSVLTTESGEQTYSGSVEQIVTYENTENTQVASYGQAQVVAPSNGPNIEAFLNEAVAMSGWEYSQSRRWDYGFADCSSIVVRALINSGQTGDHSNLTTFSIHSDPRFYQVPFESMQRGDILVTDGHMEIYMGNGQTFGAFQEGWLSGFAGNPYRFNMAYRLSGY